MKYFCDVYRMVCLLPLYGSCMVGHNYILYDVEQQRTKTCYYTFYVWIIYHNEFTLDILIYIISVYCFFLVRVSQPPQLFHPLSHKSFVCRFQNHFLQLFFFCSNPVNSKINVIRCTIKAENCVKCHIRQSIDIVLGIQLRAFFADKHLSHTHETNTKLV